MPNTSVDSTRLFKKHLSDLADDYPLVMDQIEALIAGLEENQRPSDHIPGVGYTALRYDWQTRMSSVPRAAAFA